MESANVELSKEENQKIIDQMRAHQAERKAATVAAQPALIRLMAVAERDTGQSRVIAKFLLGCYNGNRFPFDLTDFRVLDHALFNDCMLVLSMDSYCTQEIHCYFENGGQRFEKLADDWNLNK
ncbi:DUF7673 family protein [Deefgea piscis]|uniref:DUF7673 family protein n=1 Tax=Deefgea piscis TaxID=2739061 RepID=UPI001C7F6667|nr:hypothetical protein [Deefgea piscis]QZA80217.1 hypothetical protein K4H25_11805 [Deefgea piscis]